MGDVELGTKTRAAPKDGGETAIDFGKMGGKKAEPERPKDSTDFIAKAARTAAEEEEMPCLQLHLRRNWKKYVVAILLLGTLGTLAGIFLLPKNPGVQVTAITPTSVRTRRSLISPAFIAELQFAFTVTNPNYIEVAAQTLNATMFYKDEQLASRSLLYPQAELITAASERAIPTPALVFRAQADDSPDLYNELADDCRASRDESVEVELRMSMFLTGKLWGRYTVDFVKEAKLPCCLDFPAEGLTNC
eukprot:PLAT3816.2.p1 GENE.PLAT3816.2~~PLAT3816.2.p1  ORF type:complete len:248 (-),score=95.71 PLAT3816.2:48-791(-)